MNDAKRLLALRNDVEVRKNSFSSEIIDLDTHMAWLKGVLSSESRHLYVAETSAGELVANARFDKSQCHCEAYLVSFAITRPFRGQGISSLLLRKICDEFSLKHKKCDLLAEIKPENIKSIKCFEKAGFAKESECADRVVCRRTN